MTSRLVAERRRRPESRGPPRRPCASTRYGIFAERLFDASPARIARDVDDRRQRLMRPTRPRLVCRHRVERFDQFRIERRGETDRLREARPAERRVAVQAFLVKHDGNAEPALFDEEFLNRVGELGVGARALQAAAGVARPTDLADAVAVRERGARLLDVELAV